LRITDEILPADDHEQRQHDSQNGVLVLDHSTLLLIGPLIGTHLALTAAFGRTRTMWGWLDRCTSCAAFWAGADFASAMDAA
jgi:hypothetical protein